MLDKPGLLASEFCQMAYVTNDIGRAMSLFRERHQVERFLELPNFEVRTSKTGHALLNIALAYAGGVQIEIIEPLGSDDGVYRQILRNQGGFELHFHHEAQLAKSREALEHMKQSAIAHGFPVVIDGQSGDQVFYFYADCRETIGHHVEYIYYTEAAFEQVCGAIPVN